MVCVRHDCVTLPVDSLGVFSPILLHLSLDKYRTSHCLVGTIFYSRLGVLTTDELEKAVRNA